MKQLLKKYLPVLPFLVLLFLVSCDTEDAPDCFQTAGSMIEKEFQVEEFDELIVYEGINLFIEQGGEHKVMVRTGENLINEISAEVVDGRLILRNDNGCNFVRDYNITDIRVTVPDLSWLQNSGNRVIKSVGELHFPNIWLRSLNQERAKGVYTVGDFDLHLVSDHVRVTGDDFSNFFLRGSTDYLNLYIANGDGRVEAQDLIAGTVEIQHRGTNKLIVNPQQVLKGEIRSTGDAISVNRPPVVEVEVFYTGKLIFK
ncbi:Putative auto-transporter adhesin, head GIN domain [Salinimicrobium sediminis]|uniref:Auto-transporter adhesin, head GIN domain n=1 Tax=Salinimicrobium sediminis TaxID=1343891 RepID=A0A285X090_9FLAO|nr:head GIN domain-containing protein [Salinimicrobium sediminis]SOC78791.1 Putative auto-transporter adhesin, head GIN domain [Salinimicrobium sediminis]